LLQLKQISVQTVESVFPDAAEGLKPSVQLLETLGLQLVYPPIGDWMYLDEPGLAKHPEMLGNLRLVKLQLIGNLPYGQGAVT
jgi:hypothetical protein